MDLKTYLFNLSVAERDQFARDCDSTLGHVQNIAYGYRTASTELAVSIELVSKGQVTRVEMFPDSFWKRWPELRQTADFPPIGIKTTEPAAASMAPLLQAGLEKSEAALADDSTDRLAGLIKRNRAQALAEIATTPQPTTEPAAAGV